MIAIQFMSVGEDQGDYEIIQILVLGQHVATLCDDNVLRMWDLTTGGKSLSLWRSLRIYH